MQDQEFLENIIKGLVEYPDSVLVKRKVDEMGVLLTIEVDKQDMGKIIGREGTVATSVRTIMKAFGMKNQKRISMKILEPAI